MSQTATKLLDALAETIALARERAGDRIPVIGVAGAQGSGKTTLARSFAAANPDVAHFSLDDVYLPASYRRLLAHDVHPLFATRGPPGTHNLMQLNETLDELLQAESGSATHLPAFDKRTDNPVAESDRPVFRGRPSLILLEGWCLGAAGQDEAALTEPVNALEADEDAQGVWRREVNANLVGGYAQTFTRIDALFYLRAPDFGVVHRWRCQQQEDLLGRVLTESESALILRFVHHFERLTRHMLSGGVMADITVQLDENRTVTSVTKPSRRSI